MSSILYLPAHSVLECDEVRLLQSLGHNVYTVSSLLSQKEPFADTSKIDTTYLNTLRGFHKDLPQSRQQLTAAFMSLFDTVISVHDYRWLQENRQLLTGKRCILRTIGQYLPSHEAELRGITERNFEVVRYSPAEQNIQGYAGHDAIIRFYKDPDEYGGWTGETRAILCFGNTLLRRPSQVLLSFMLQATAGFDLRLYGGSNEGLSAWRGKAKPEDMVSLYKTHAVYYSHHTLPASYTLSFIEALMTGTPVVAPGFKALVNATLGGGFRDAAAFYEVPSIVENGKSGYTVNSVEEAHAAFALVLADQKAAAAIGAAGRRMAISLFGIETVRAQWQRFLGN
ncbi:glycosyltransferase [Methylobacterium soli]|uniref:Glycosyltransferase n=1 Tax=Methylobacterium soli TaxID=553447 RepID=A0A6L3SVE8_9HYPH|nr:glycosyltransferase [Methylobacterium soli]KAB1076510.1 glycosyltransferase [Methylobacterium soli]GJE44852.1 hypothetical protein AEGHOMDF_4043 [Methylobacterium soli]